MRAEIRTLRPTHVACDGPYTHRLQQHHPLTTHTRNRRLLCVMVLLTIGLGLASRRFPHIFPAALGKYPGDALWAQMVYWLVGFCAPVASVVKVSLMAVAISCADELSQLYQAPWINQVRATTLGHLVLGSRFSWLDMLSYTIGVALVAPLDGWLLRRRPGHA